MEPEHCYPSIGNAGQYNLHLKIGEGGQAHVYLGSKDLQLYAVKVYQLGVSKEQAFQLQVDCLKKMNYPLLINMVDYQSKTEFKIGNGSEEKRNIVVLQLADGGELYQYIAKFGRFPAQICRYYAKQMVQVLQYLNSKEITHRDIKPQNILFDSNFNLKMSDFGLSRDAKGKFGDYKLYSRVGTEGYRSPQMEDGKYNGLQSDMFAIGVVLFVMYSGYPPFMSTKHHDRIYKLIREKNFTKFWEKHEKGKPEGFYDSSFKRLINSFLSLDPERRPTFESLEDDQWWNGNQISQSQLEQHMKAKADIMFQNSQIIEIKKEILKEKIKEEAEQIMEDECTRQCPEQFDENMPQEQQFVETYKSLNIEKEDLPQFTIQKLPYSSQQPNFVVAWIKNCLITFFKENQTFIPKYAESIEPYKYTFNYNEKKNEIEIKLQFLMEQQDITELQILGKVHKSNRQGIGVKWIKREGNYYWLISVESRLMEELRKIS